MKLLWKKKKTMVLTFIVLTVLALTIGVVSVFAADTTSSVGVSSSFDKFTPIHYYSFDNDNGTTVVDSGSSPINGTVAAGNSSLLTGYDGTGYARHFNGDANNYINFNNKVLPIGKKSISFKIKKDNLPQIIKDGEYFFSNINSFKTDFGMDGFFLKSGVLGFAFTNANSQFGVPTSKNLCDKNWHSVLLTWDGKLGTEIRVYVDSFEIPDSKVISTFADTNAGRYNLTIGSLANGVSNKFDGYLDEFKVYDKVIVMPAPVAIKAEKVGEPKGVKVEWKAVDGANGYNVYRSETQGTGYGEPKYISGNKSIEFIDTNVVPGKKYYYVVTACNEDGAESVFSNEVSFETEPAPTPVGKNALLRITMVTGEIKEYEMSGSEIQAFVTWANSKGSGTPTYTINKTYNLGPFKNRNDYLVFDKIANFEIMEY